MSSAARLSASAVSAASKSMGSTVEPPRALASDSARFNARCAPGRESIVHQLKALTSGGDT